MNAVERRHTQKVCERQLKEMQRKVEVSKIDMVPSPVQVLVTRNEEQLKIGYWNS